MGAVDTASGNARAFWTYWAAGATSSVGSAVTAVALPLAAVIGLGATATQMGVLTAASYVAWIVIGLPAGALVSRLPLRATQVSLDLARATALASIPLAWWLHRLTFWHLVGVALVISFADVVFDVANSTFMPRVVPRHQLQGRNSLMSGTHAASQLGGPSLGGLLVQLFGAAPALIADALSYLASAALLRTLPETARETGGSSHRPRITAMIRDGWHFVVRHPLIGPCMWDATVLNFVCGGQMALFALYLVHVTGAPAALVGLLLGAEGVGALLGAAMTPRLSRAVGTARLCVVGGWISFVGALVIPLGDHVSAWAAFAAGTVVFAAGVVFVSTTTRTYRQVATPEELLPRVMATVRFVSWGAIPLGGLAAGALASTIGVRSTLWTLAALTAVAPLILLSSRMRGLRHFPEMAA